MEPVPELSAEESASAARALAYEYDYLKQCTTLALAGLGGLITLAGSIFARVPDKSGLAWSGVLFALGAVAAFQGQNALVDRARLPGQLRSPPRGWRLVATGTIGLGAGALLRFAADALG